MIKTIKNIFRKQTIGFLRFKDVSQYNGEKRNLEGIKEIHFGYEKDRVSFEFEDTGFTVNLQDIKEFEIKIK